MVTIIVSLPIFDTANFS
uniref:Uncharacterized protein n=1 Tax=Arundo donax TaxID=35708 RepID=A0A0A9CFR1_ARUDO